MKLLTLFFMFFKIGLFTFGGGYAMIPLIMSETVKANLLTSEELIDFIAVSEATPGPFAVNIATYVGMKTAGLPGAVSSTLGVVLPSFMVILLVVKFYESYKSNKVIQGAMKGLKPCVVGLIGAAAVSIFKTVFVPNGTFLFETSVITFILSVVLFLLVLFLAIKKKPPIALIVMSAIIGIISGYIFNL